MSSHPFDRYAPFTDVTALKEFSALPLRKSVRVNTLKMSVEDFQNWAKKEGWQLEPVPWCEEAFFIDRDDKSTALGKDLLHLLGHIYLQEASSMLPVALLDPQPGMRVLDMAAAPGSKTTQIAARMQGRGAVVANDMKESRLRTLKEALHRSGVVNYVVMKHMGQWYGQNMVERFDRVLCDAPCTAQGTVRKDPDALKYCSVDSIGKMAKLQRELLESAVYACKVGGRIIYSTCTLTPEENEEVVASILNKFSDQVIALDPIKSGILSKKIGLHKSIKDSQKIQKGSQSIRLWPQAHNTEGFFCAVLEKKATTKDPAHYKPEHFQERPLRKQEQERFREQLTETYGTDFVGENGQLFERENEVFLSTEDVAGLHLPSVNYHLGLPFGKKLKDKSVRLAHDLAIARGYMATKNVVELNDDQMKDLLAGKDSSCDSSLSGDVILKWNSLFVGLGLARDGHLKNKISRWLVQQRQE